jgi:hypothetical protein
MTTTRAPLRVARAGIDIATRLLPSSSARYRYRAEFTAELHQLGAVAQVVFTVGVLSRVLALRAALGHRSAPWRCRLLRWHVWGRRSTEDGGRYAACDRCGTELGAAGFGPMTTPPWPGYR